MSDLISREAVLGYLTMTTEALKLRDAARAEGRTTVIPLSEVQAFLDAMAVEIRALPPAQEAAPDLSVFERYGESVDYDMYDNPYDTFGPDEHGEYVRIDAVEALLSSRAAAPDHSGDTNKMVPAPAGEPVAWRWKPEGELDSAWDVLCRMDVPFPTRIRNDLDLEPL